MSVKYRLGISRIKCNKNIFKNKVFRATVPVF